MTEYRNAWYQGTAFAMFFLSLVLIAICGILHGFGSEICIFMAFYTAIEGHCSPTEEAVTVFYGADEGRVSAAVSGYARDVYLLRTWF